MIKDEVIEAAYDEYLDTVTYTMDDLHAELGKISAEAEARLVGGTLDIECLARLEEAAAHAAFATGFTAAMQLIGGSYTPAAADAAHGEE